MLRRELMLLAAAMMAAPVLARGQYHEVTPEDVISMRLNHYSTPDKKGRLADFEWLFFKADFVIKRGEGPIPKDLSTRLAPGIEVVDEIKGKWRLKDGKLELTDVKVGKAAGKSLSLPIYRTAPTVIRVGDPQYVFAANTSGSRPRRGRAPSVPGA